MEKEPKGYIALMTVIIISAVVLAIASTVSLLAIGEAQNSLALSKGENTLQLVEGCTEDALLKAQADGAYTGGNITRPEGTCIVSVAKNGNNWTVTVTSAAQDYNRTIQVAMNRTGNISLNSWLESLPVPTPTPTNTPTPTPTNTPIPTPTNTPVPTNTPTPTNTPIPTPTNTPVPTNTPTPTPTNTPIPTPTNTPVPTNTPTPTPTASPTPIPRYTISGTVYKDTNGNGVQDGGEVGYQTATVTLSGGSAGTTTTNSSGVYSFANLLANTYTVTLTIPGGYQKTTSNPVTIPVSANTTQNFGIMLVPTPTPTITPTPTHTPTPTPTHTPTPTPTPTILCSTSSNNLCSYSNAPACSPNGKICQCADPSFSGHDKQYSCSSGNWVYSQDVSGFCSQACNQCLSADTVIATPNGQVKVTDLKPGMIVWTVTTSGEKVSAPILKTTRTHVSPTHEMVHFTMADGRELYVSKGHPTADGRGSEQLKVGDKYSDSIIVNIEIVFYKYSYTYDLLPAGETGYYFANGIIMGSTIKDTK